MEEKRFCVECNLINGKHFYFNDVALDDDTDLIYTTFEEAWKCLGDILSHKVSTQDNLLAWLREFTQDESSLGCITSFQVVEVIYNEEILSWEEIYLHSPIIDHYWDWDRQKINIATYKNGRLKISSIYDFSLRQETIPLLIKGRSEDLQEIAKDILTEIWETDYPEESKEGFFSHYREEILITIKDLRFKMTFQLLYKNS